MADVLNQAVDATMRFRLDNVIWCDIEIERMRVWLGMVDSAKRQNEMEKPGSWDAGHAGCHERKQQKTLGSYLTGFGAAFLACVCCLVPLIPLMLGLSGGSLLLSLSKYHVLFDVLGGLILLAALLYIWHEHKAGGMSAFRSKEFLLCLVVTILMYGSMNILIKNFVVPKLLNRQAGAEFHHEVGR